MKLRKNVKIVGGVLAASTLTALVLHDHPESWTVNAKMNEPMRTYAEKTTYPAGDFFLVGYTGRTMIDDEDFKIKLVKKTYVMARNLIVMRSEREVKVSREFYNSVEIGESGVKTFKNELPDVDVPVK